MKRMVATIVAKLTQSFEPPMQLTAQDRTQIGNAPPGARPRFGSDLAEDRLTVSATHADRGTNPTAKLATLVGRKFVGADSISYRNIRGHSGMKSLIDSGLAPGLIHI